jgi:hypothetical protein
MNRPANEKPDNYLHPAFEGMPTHITKESKRSDILNAVKKLRNNNQM